MYKIRKIPRRITSRLKCFSHMFIKNHFSSERRGCFVCFCSFCTRSQFFFVECHKWTVRHNSNLTYARNSCSRYFFMRHRNLHKFSFTLCCSLTSLIITFPLKVTKMWSGGRRRWNVIQCAFTRVRLKYMFIALNVKTKAFKEKLLIDTQFPFNLLSRIFTSRPIKKWLKNQI